MAMAASLATRNFRSFALRGRLALPRRTLPVRKHHEDGAKAKAANIPPISAGQVWHNELGSVMEITSVDSYTGVFSGAYCSKVGEAKYSYVLTGRQDTEGTSLGWTVNWKNDFMNAHSVTTWSGQEQCFRGDPVLITTWLLTSQTTPDQDWESTMVGFDRFFLTQPSPEDQEKAKLHCKKSHPQGA